MTQFRDFRVAVALKSTLGINYEHATTMEFICIAPGAILFDGARIGMVLSAPAFMQPVHTIYNFHYGT